MPLASANTVPETVPVVVGVGVGVGVGVVVIGSETVPFAVAVASVALAGDETVSVNVWSPFVAASAVVGMAIAPLVWPAAMVRMPSASATRPSVVSAAPVTV